MLAPEGRVVMISGANRGIGLAVARRLLDAGYSLSLGARDRAALAEAFADAEPARLLCQGYDALAEGSDAAWVEATLARYGRIDGLVNNAGIAAPARIEDGDEAFDRLWAVNVKGPLRLIRHALPELRKAGSGRVINLASLSGKRVANDNAGYAMSKFAVMALSHATRQAGWEDGVRVTALCPSFVATDMTASVQSVAREDMIQPDDLAELVATLLALPNSASVAELLVNCRLETML